MNSGKAPLYIGFVLVLFGFLIVLNSYWNLKSEVGVNQQKLNQLQQQLDQQAKPCQTEDLLRPELSAGCNIPPSPTASSNNSSTQGSSAAIPNASVPATPTPITPQSQQQPPPEPTPPPEQCTIELFGVCI